MSFVYAIDDLSQFIGPDCDTISLQDPHQAKFVTTQQEKMTAYNLGQNSFMLYGFFDQVQDNSQPITLYNMRSSTPNTQLLGLPFQAIRCIYLYHPEDYTQIQFYEQPYGESEMTTHTHVISDEQHKLELPWFPISSPYMISSSTSMGLRLWRKPTATTPVFLHFDGLQLPPSGLNLHHQPFNPHAVANHTGSTMKINGRNRG
jgi:hypothetical protein